MKNKILPLLMLLTNVLIATGVWTTFVWLVLH